MTVNTAIPSTTSQPVLFIVTAVAAIVVPLRSSPMLQYPSWRPRAGSPSAGDPAEGSVAVTHPLTTVRNRRWMVP